MSVGRAQPALFVLLCIFVACFPPAAFGGFFEHLLPAWPLSNVGDPIPDDLIGSWRAAGEKCPGIKGQFSAFPSKANRDPTDNRVKGTLDPWDPDDICDDGGQTTYNGLLCASGEAAGCVAVAEAQDNTGRWFRSPHRRWMWAHRCSDKKHPLDPKKFADNCTYGFTPDMTLGVLLYTLKTRDTRRYDSWLKWLDSTASTTKLCKLDGDQVQDCIAADWPRVCTEDFTHLVPGESPGFAINDRYGGNCVLRPWDALDFSAVTEATSTATPPRLGRWDAEARAIIKASKEILSAGVGGGPATSDTPTARIPTQIIMSSVDDRRYPTHLDAIRVLVRMMIRNPSLKLENLPSAPDPDDVLPGAFNLASDLTDPVSIKSAADAIAMRVPWDPFYQLLSDGPSPRVRSMIIDHCPGTGDRPSNRDWIWEKASDVDGSRSHGMGWDCVFAGNLYNAMRVKKALVDDLLALFPRYVDALGASLTRASEALELAEAADRAAQRTVDEAERDLREAQDFISNEYAQQRQAALGDISALTTQLAQLTNQATALDRQLVELSRNALTLPDAVQQQMVTQACRWDPWPETKICDNVTSTIDVANPAKRKLLDDIASVGKAAEDLRNGEIASTQASLAVTNELVANLDRELQVVRGKLQRKTLQTVINFARAELRLKTKSVDAARKLVADTQRASARVKGYLCVWRNEAKCAS